MLWTKFTSGTKTVTSASSPEALAASQRCLRVHVCARIHTDGTALNTAPVFLRSDKTNTAAGFVVEPADFKGYVFEIDDPSKLYVKVCVDGEGVHYNILE